MTIVSYFGEEGEEDFEMIMIILLVINVLCTFYFFCWAFGIKNRVPDYMGKLMQDGAFGLSFFILK
jgi:hypothetical protein